MSERRRVPIDLLHTGVPGLDAVMGGGLPQYSFNLIAGGPGAGKTTLTQQIMFANATAEHPALHFTVLGEPPLKMLRYQQQFDFFDPDKVDKAIIYRNLSQEVLESDLGRVLDRIVREVEQTGPALVVVDSFRTVVRATTPPAAGELGLQTFVQRLALHLTSWQATTFLVGEYVEMEMRDNPVFTVADGILWLHQAVERNSVVRKLQVLKMRGQAPMPGLHTFRINEEGLRVFPRAVETTTGKAATQSRPAGRVSTGVTGLDEMMGGGIPTGDAVIVAGPSGSGKTALATNFIAEGARRDEPGVIAVFEERPKEYLARAKSFGFDLEAMIDAGNLKVIYLRPLDLSVDETLEEVRGSVAELGAKRVVIDSLSGFEIALAPTFREDFRESLYRLVSALTADGVTIMMTVESSAAYTDLRFTPHTVSFLTDDIIVQRYVELEGELRTVIGVVKMRGSAHSRELRACQVTGHGLVVGESLGEYSGLITGVPRLREPVRSPAYAGLTESEQAVLRVLIERREAPAEDVARAMELDPTEVQAALERLVALTYAIREEARGRTVYRPVAQALET
ncbi:MAG TPA: ATPase domain-containing protein [Longimicrobiales bacterium]